MVSLKLSTFTLPAFFLSVLFSCSFLFLFFTLSSVFGQSQAGGTDNRELYYDAVEAYETGHHRQSLTLFRRLERNLGSTNPRIQPFIVLNMIALDSRDDEIMREIRRYKNLESHDSAMEKAMTSYLHDLEKEESSLYLDARFAGDADQYRTYLRKYPRGRYRDIVSSELESIDNEIFTRFRNNPSIFGAVEYLDAFPRGIYSGEIGAVLLEHVRQEVRQQKWGTAETTLASALERNFIIGSEETDKLQQVIDEGITWERYRSDRTIENGIAYIKKYPRGKHIDILDQQFANTAENSYENYLDGNTFDDINTALYWHNVYIKWFPEGKHINNIRTREKQLTAARERILSPTYLLVPIRFGLAFQAGDGIGFIRDDVFNSFAGGIGVGVSREKYFILIEAGMSPDINPPVSSYEISSSPEITNDRYAVPAGDELYTDMPPFDGTITIGFSLAGAFKLAVEGGYMFYPFPRYRKVNVYNESDDTFIGEGYEEVDGIFRDGSPIMGVSLNFGQSKNNGFGGIIGIGARARIENFLQWEVTYEAFFRFAFGFNVNPYAK